MKRRPKYPLTQEEAHDWCVESWNDMAENSYTAKYQSPIMCMAKYDFFCFACDYYAMTKGVSCNNCPFPFDDCLHGDSPYRKWCEASTIEQIKRYAIEIADLFI